MGSRVGAILKKRKLAGKKDNTLQNLKVGVVLGTELQEVLDASLQDYDSVMIEIDPSMASSFLGVLEGFISLTYDFTQISANQFVFSIKRIAL